MKTSKRRPHNWQGGRYVTYDGYVRILRPDHPTNYRGYVLEHRYVIEKHLGRTLKSSEIVHHIDGNKLNNSFENLEILTNSEHRSIHSPKGSKFGINTHPRISKYPRTFICKYCKKEFRNKLLKKTMTFCSKKCHQHYRRDIAPRKNPKNFTCIQCHKVFINYANKKIMYYCSKKCSGIGRRSP